jgi:outer membrane biosynthesis protein TonB
MDADELIQRTADSVRQSLEAAQRRADQIVRDAEAEAQRIRAGAEAAAKRAHEAAETEAQRRLEEVRAALDNLQGRLSAGGGEGRVDPAPVPVPEPEPPTVPEPTPDPSPEPMPEPVPEPSPEPVPEPTPPPDEADTPAAKAPEGQASGNGDATARLVAMKLALEGTSLDEARKQLADEYEVGDLDALLEDVYAKAGKPRS